MKKHLLTHEWLRTRGVLGIIAAGVLAVWAVGMVLAAIGILAPLALAACILACALLLPATALYLTIDYWRSAYGRQGYLTHALPVRGSTHYWVRLGYAVVILTVAVLLTLILVAGTVLLFSVGYWQSLADLSSMVGAFFEQIGATGIAWMVVWLLFVLAGFWGWQSHLYFAASFGSESRLGRFGVGGPILAYAVLYVIQGVVGLLGMLIPLGLTFDEYTGQPSLVTQGYFSLLFNPGQGNGLLPLGTLLFTLILTLVLIWRTTVSWDRKVALR